MKKKIYFARPVTHYNTPQDKEDIHTILDMGFDIEDPNSEKNETEYKERGMGVFLDLVKSCDGLIFRSFYNGMMSAGVIKEIQQAREHGLFVMELPTITPKRYLDVEETRQYIRAFTKK